MGRVEAVCICDEKGRAKKPAPAAELRADFGIVGDAHAGSGHRQTSILSASDVAQVRRVLPDVSAGDFAENLLLSGLDLSDVGLGSVIRVGPRASLSITQIGKVCHAPCRIGQAVGDCIMPRLGLFARVVEGGPVAPGDIAEIVRAVSRKIFQAAVLTVSDRCHAGTAQDTAGPAVADLLIKELGANIYKIRVVPDEIAEISRRLAHYCDGHSIDLVAAVGGTGFSPRDVTPEATRAVVERLAPGLDEAMRQVSLAKTPHAMLSRGASGIRGRTLIINLPGSLRGATENLRTILPALAHGLAKLRGDPADCGR
ncbi:MAG: hypothetical protein HZA50_19235 [Planctomycetes bacterium]|nr:hypothetical protein [Planctomycetota bacterium]